MTELAGVDAMYKLEKEEQSKNIRGFSDTVDPAVFDDILNVNQIGDWIHWEIEFVADDGDYWQSPSETLRLGTGDCEDMAILHMYIAYVKFGVKLDMARVASKQVTDRIDTPHVEVGTDMGEVVDSDYGGIYKRRIYLDDYYNIKYTFTYDDLFIVN